MYADQGDLDTGAGEQDASDGTEDTVPLTHIHRGHTGASRHARSEIFGDCAKTACSGSRVRSRRRDALDGLRCEEESDRRPQRRISEGCDQTSRNR